jgi:hypothetical protein
MDRAKSGGASYGVSLREPLAGPRVKPGGDQRLGDQRLLVPTEVREGDLRGRDQ